MTDTPAMHSRRTPGRRRWRAVGAGVAFALIAAMTVVAARGYVGGRQVGTPAAASAVPATAEVRRETLVDEVTVKGRLDHGAAVPVLLSAVGASTGAASDATSPGVPGTGTVTWLPPVGAPVKRGQAMLRVDDQAVVLLYGSIPMYRPLAPGITGDDVRQFERNLNALGYNGFTVDKVYTKETAAAVSRWQTWMGRPANGVVQPGQVVYAPDAVRVAARRVRVGAAATGEVLTYTGSGRVVTVEAEADKVAWATHGRNVTIVLPDGRTAPGTVEGVATTAADAADQGGAAGAQTGSPPPATIAVTVKVGDERALGAYEGGPVQVRYVAKEQRDVLTVPVVALLALAEGGYGLEVVDGDGSHIIAVEVGMFVAAKVEVRASELVEHMRVGIPS